MVQFNGPYNRYHLEEVAATNSNTIENYIFDEAGTQLAFIVQEKQGMGTTNALWYYGAGMKKAILMANNQSAGITPGCTISNTLLTSAPAEGISFLPSCRQQTTENPKQTLLK